MNWLRMHWYDIGLFLAIGVGAWLMLNHLSPMATLLWISLITLFLHQFEEYRYPGYFPGMVNTVLFHSQIPDRYPLNSNTALIVNVVVGWGAYALAAVFAGSAIWLGIAPIPVSLGNFIEHTFLFNIIGKTRYNPGMATAILLFLPVALYFFYLVLQGHLATPFDWGLGIVLGIALNYLGIIKLIDWLKDERSPYIFPPRSMIPDSRKAARKS